MKKNATEQVINATERVSGTTDNVVTPSKSETKTEKESTLVYCGPTIKGVVTQYSHFNNGIPKKLKGYAEKNKAVKRLLVPIEKIVEAKRNIQIKGTVENISYNKILNAKGE